MAFFYYYKRRQGSALNFSIKYLRKLNRKALKQKGNKNKEKILI